MVKSYWDESGSHLTDSLQKLVPDCLKLSESPFLVSYMALQAKVFSAKPDNLSSSPRTHKGERPILTSRPLTCTHVHIWKISKRMFLRSPFFGNKLNCHHSSWLLWTLYDCSEETPLQLSGTEVLTSVSGGFAQEQPCTMTISLSELGD